MLWLNRVLGNMNIGFIEPRWRANISAAMALVPVRRQSSATEVLEET